MGCGASTGKSPNVAVTDNAVLMPKQKTADARLDEFEEATVCPLPDNGLASAEFKNGHPSFRGDEVVPCFDGGLLFRVVKHDIWAFYNDTRSYEMHVSTTFGKESQLTALGRTKMTQDETSKEFLADAIVYPGETVMYVKGNVLGHRIRIKALALSDAFLESRVKVYYERMEPELNQLQKISGEFNSENKLIAHCVKANLLYVDLHFLPNQESIMKNSNRTLRPVPWARPNIYLSEQLSSLVRVFRNKISPMSIDQGSLGDSWVMGAIATMAENPNVVKNAFRHPSDPSLTAKERNVGVYRVTINKHGWWRSIVVDSFLPMIGGKAKYAMSKDDPCEMWVSILEKAYAKAHGSYANIISGDPLHAAQDLMGYPTTRHDESFANTSEADGTEFFERLENYTKRGFQIILSTPSEIHRHSLSVTQSPAGSAEEAEKLYRTAGLLIGHAYTVRRVRFFKSDNVALFEICNPWLRNVEWKGSWGKGDRKWKKHPEIARECGHPSKDEGYFWMSWKDVSRYFDGCGVVFTHLSSHDYRIRGTFKNSIPSVCVQITVQKQVSMVFMLSQDDIRGSSTKETGFPPIMLSLAKGKGSFGEMVVDKNTNLDIERPTSQFVFLRSRDVGMTCELTPEDSPYLLVPRILDRDDAEAAYVIGILCNEELGTSEIKTEFCVLPGNCAMFTNSTTYSGAAKSVSTNLQFRRANSGFPVESMTKKVSAKNYKRDSKEM